MALQMKLDHYLPKRANVSASFLSNKCRFTQHLDRDLEAAIVSSLETVDSLDQDLEAVIIASLEGVNGHEAVGSYDHLHGATRAFETNNQHQKTGIETSNKDEHRSNDNVDVDDIGPQDEDEFSGFGDHRTWEYSQDDEVRSEDNARLYTEADDSIIESAKDEFGFIDTMKTEVSHRALPHVDGFTAEDNMDSVAASLGGEGDAHHEDKIPSLGGVADPMPCSSHLQTTLADRQDFGKSEEIKSPELLAGLCSEQHTLIQQFLQRPSVKEHRANLEAILKRDCSDAFVSPITRIPKLGSWPSYGDKEIDTQYEKFILKETRESQRPKEHLVKPAGTLSAPLFLQLHYPTFHSKRSSYGESYDETNQSMWHLINQKGLRATDGILFSESSFRRERPEPQRYRYPEHYCGDSENLFLVHREFSHWMMDHSQAKVVVLFGTANAGRFLRRFPESLLVCTLGTTNESHGRVFISLETAKSPSRIVMTCKHPETLLASGSRMPFRDNCLFDYTLNLAYALAGVQGKINANCFINRAASVYRAVVKDQESLKLAMRIVESQVVSGRAFLPEHEPHELVHELQAGLHYWRPSCESSIDQLIRDIVNRNAGIDATNGYPQLRLLSEKKAKTQVEPSSANKRAKISHAVQKATGFPALQRARANQKAIGYLGLRAGSQKIAKITLDNSDRKLGFQGASGNLPRRIEVRCMHDDCQQALPPDLSPRYTSKGEYLAKLTRLRRKKIAHPGCSHLTTVAIPQDPQIEHVKRELAIVSERVKGGFKRKRNKYNRKSRAKM